MVGSSSRPTTSRRALIGAAAATLIAPRARASTATTVGEIPVGKPGFARMDNAPNAWAASLRALPLRSPGTPVLDYQGKPVSMGAFRVIDLPLVPGDLQQCADSILRLRASYERASGLDPAFRYTSGFVSRWSAWAKGDRPTVRGNLVQVRATGKIDNSNAAFEAWLADLFMYAGTRSLMRDTLAVEGGITDVQPGDIVGYGGSPGHAVLILDVATNGTSRLVLVGQGFMPAMDFHLCAGPENGWFAVGGTELPTQPLAVPWSGLRRFAAI